MLTYYLAIAWRRVRQDAPMVVLLVATMAVGIAATMTAMTVFHALSGEPLPGISDSLYTVTMDAREQVEKDSDSYKPDNLVGLRDAKALVDAGRASRQIALTMSVALFSSPDGKTSDRVPGLVGYGPLIATLGVPMRYGRPWTHAEQLARDPVVVIDVDLAQKLFGVADAVGRSVRLGDREFRVVGVSAPWKPRVKIIGYMNFGGSPLGQNKQFFVPVGAALAAGIGPFNSGECAKGSPVIRFQSTDVSGCRWLETWVALDSAAAVGAYQQFVAGYATAQHTAGRFAYPPKAKLYGTRAWMALNHVVPDDVRLNLMLAAAFLLLCMVNVAGLLAARFLRRQSDVVVRRALGASRRSVFAQHMVEAGMLGLVGALAALPLTLVGLWIVRIQPVAYAAAAQFDVGVFARLVVLALAVGLVVGVLPAWRVCRQPPAVEIKVG